jgi:hypothetical protein
MQGKIKTDHRFWNDNIEMSGQNTQGKEFTQNGLHFRLPVREEINCGCLRTENDNIWAIDGKGELNTYR